MLYLGLKEFIKFNVINIPSDGEDVDRSLIPCE